MIWTIDTGAKGAAGCKDSTELRTVLEAAMAHFADTGMKAAFASVLRTMNPQSLSEKPDPDHVEAKQTEAKEAKDKFAKKFALVQEQMKAGIDAACALADHIGGPVTATVTGHLARSHASGVENRISVAVDAARPQDD